MRRTRSMALVLSVVAATTLTACSIVKPVNADKARTSHGPISIWYSNNPQEVTWGKQVVKAWNAQHPDEKVTGQEIPTGKTSEAVIQASIIAGTEPCLIYNTSPASVPSFQLIGGLVALDQFPGATKYIEDRSGSQADQYKSPDGQFYQLPWKSNPVMIFYNKKLFAKAGLDPDHPKLASYADFIATAKQLVAKHVSKYAIYPAPSSEFFQSWYDFYSMYAAESGGKQLIENNKATFDNPAGRAVANFWAQIYSANLAGKETYNGDSFADGVAAMSIVGPWAVAQYKGKVDWGVVPVPTESGTASPHTFSDAKNVAMYASCTHRQTAWDFLKFSTSEAQDGKFLDITGQMPTRANVLQVYASYFAKNPGYKPFAELTNGIVEVPNVPNSVEIWQQFRDAWSKSVIFGNGSVNSSLTATAKAINETIQKK
jgi:multiple sugar transport system substrate-binding protein